MSDAPPNRQALIHPLVGARPSLYLRRYRQHAPYDRRSRLARCLTTLVLAGRMPLQWADQLGRARSLGTRRAPEPPQDPIFIIGHWRSGTTHLHNILSHDPQFGWLTVIPGLFPDGMQGILPRLAAEYLKRTLPKKRSFDNVRIGLDTPQEEEICLANLCGLSYFNCYYYPRGFLRHFRESVLLDGVSAARHEELQEAYRALAARLSAHCGGRRLLLKNPSATARIRLLKRVFPRARFVCLIRNPFIVFASSLRRLPAMLHAFAWQDYRHLDLERVVLDCYRLLMQRYLDDSPQLSPEELIEIRFEDLAAEPQQIAERVYRWLQLPMPRDAIAAYLDSLAGYERNVHRLSVAQIERISREWAFALARWNYSLPSEIAAASSGAGAA